MRRLGFDLIILGSPVSGKDTQANLLMNHYELKPIRSGVFLRNLFKNPKYKKILDKTYGKGLPAPSSIIDKFIKDSVDAAPKSKNLLFVGTPRLKNEAVLLKKQLDKKKRDFFAIYIKLSDKEITKRSFHRGRESHDKDIEYIKNRIAYHKKEVKKTVDYFKKMKKLKYIDGGQPVLKVTRDIQLAINDYQRS
jgi:adenylate kinase